MIEKIENQKDELTNVQMMKAEHLDAEMREEHDLPKTGLVIAETWSNPLRQELHSAKNGINDYLKRRGGLK